MTREADIIKPESFPSGYDGSVEPDAKHYGLPLVEESEILSPGGAGHVFNPIVWAEFRRWRARPISYLLIVLLVFVGIAYMHEYHDVVMMKLRAQGGTALWIDFVMYLSHLMRLLLRPSTVLPLLMVWRALMSFRGGQFYKPFRTTFLTPGDFLWGVIAVPVVLSALLLIVYTGWVLAPDRLFTPYYSRPEEFRTTSPYWIIMAILFEGGLNGALVAFVTLYFGVRGKGRLLSLLPILYTIIMIQGLQGYLFIHMDKVYQVLNELPSAWAEHFIVWSRRLFVPPKIAEKVIMAPDHFMTPLRQMWSYYFVGIPKFILCVILWSLTRKHLAKKEE